LSKKIAVIGFGNTLRRDDGIGIVILESLLKIYKRKDMDYLNCGSASFDLLNRFKNYDKVLIIDGINAGLRIGELKIGKVKDLDNKLVESIISTHTLSLKSVLDLSKELGIKANIYLAGIQVKDISFGEGLTETLNQKKNDIIEEIIRFIKKTF